MIYTVFGEVLRVFYYLGLIYYLLLVIYIVCTWISGLYYTKLFSILRTIASPFNRLFSGKLVVGGSFDLGYLLGLILFDVGLNAIKNVSYMI